MAKLIAISGGSGSGKTFLAHAIKENLREEATILSFDNYYRDQSHLSFVERAAINYDDPVQLDAELFLSHVNKLSAGEMVNVPQYDFATHVRKKVTRPVKSSPWIICEGIMVLTLPKNTFDYSIYVDADDDIRLLRRIIRDVITRGRTIESVGKQYLESVKPMHKKYVEPCREIADFIYINNHNNGIDRVQLKKLIDELFVL